MPEKLPRPRRPSSPRFPRGPRWSDSARFSPVVLVSMALGIYLVTFWFGITIVGDNPFRSAIMAGVVLLIAATGYLVNGRPNPPPTGDR